MASREMIINAATQLFNQNGYHATSMEDVAYAVSVKKPSLYHYFNSKEAILLAILEAGMDILIKQLEIVAASDGSCIEKLRAAITIHIQTIADNPAGAAVFLREDRGLGDAYVAQYVANRDQFEGAFRTIVQQGVEQGQFRAIDVPIAVQALMGMNNWAARWYHAGGRLTANQIADQFADLLLEGLLARE